MDLVLAQNRCDLTGEAASRARAAVTLFRLFIYDRCQFPPFPVRKNGGRGRAEYEAAERGENMEVSLSQ